MTAIVNWVVGGGLLLFVFVNLMISLYQQVARITIIEQWFGGYRIRMGGPREDFTISYAEVERGCVLRSLEIWVTVISRTSHSRACAVILTDSLQAWNFPNAEMTMAEREVVVARVRSFLKKHEYKVEFSSL